MVNVTEGSPPSPPLNPSSLSVLARTEPVASLEASSPPAAESQQDEGGTKQEQKSRVSWGEDTSN